MIKAFLQNMAPGRKFILLIALTAVFLLISALVGMLAALIFYGNDMLLLLANPDFSDPRKVSALKLMQIINMAGGLLLPAVIYLYIAEEKPLDYCRIQKIPVRYSVLFTIMLTLCMQPVIGYLGELNSIMKLPDFLSGVEQWMKLSEEQANRLSKAFLETSSIEGLLVNIFMIALLPAITEELLFRGIIARLFRQITGNIHWAAVLSACLFAAIHMQFYGFLPRFLLGVIFAYLLFRTGTLWIPILAHFTNNLLSVVADYLFSKGVLHMSSEELGTTSNNYVLIGSLVFSLALFWLIWRSSVKIDNE